jgi:hypothetical protein
MGFELKGVIDAYNSNPDSCSSTMRSYTYTAPIFRSDRPKTPKNASLCGQCRGFTQLSGIRKHV